MTIDYQSKLRDSSLDLQGSSEFFDRGVIPRACRARAAMSIGGADRLGSE
jgi:hypothetical protein